VNTKISTAHELAENIGCDGIKRNFLNFIDFCTDLKLKPRLYASEKMNIKYKGKMILRFDPSCLDGSLSIFFTVGYFHELSDILSSLSEDIQQFFIENNRRCNKELCIGCKPIPKRVLNILGADHELCWTEMVFRNPTKEQFEYIKKFVAIRREHIKNVTI